MSTPIEIRVESLRKIMAKTRGEGAQALGAWFIGPRGESHDLLWSLINRAVYEAVEGRKTTYPHDPDWTDLNSEEYKTESQFIHDNFDHLVKNLKKECVPFSSYRYQGHMLWDQTLPSLAGYFAALLYNQNNVAAEASPLHRPRNGGGFRTVPNGRYGNR